MEDAPQSIYGWRRKWNWSVLPDKSFLSAVAPLWFNNVCGVSMELPTILRDAGFIAQATAFDAESLREISLFGCTFVELFVYINSFVTIFPFQSSISSETAMFEANCWILMLTDLVHTVREILWSAEAQSSPILSFIMRGTLVHSKTRAKNDISSL
jgi:hypothetical protein